MTSRDLTQDIEILEKVQLCATKMVYGFNDSTYEHRLRTTFEIRSIRSDLIEVFKIIKGLIKWIILNSFICLQQV